MSGCGCGSSFDPSTSLFAGMSDAQLRQALANAQVAYQEMLLGERGVKFSYTQGDGAKAVEFTPTSPQQIMMLIRQLQLQLGLISRARRPIRLAFTR